MFINCYKKFTHFSKHHLTMLILKICTHCALIVTLISGLNLTEDDDDDIFYILQSRNQPGTKFNNKHLESITLDGTKLTILMVHGWTESSTTPYCLEMAQEFLKKHDCNFIRVDWSTIASESYMVAFSLIKTIGESVGKFVIKLHTSKNVSYSKVQVIGHSLGGHIAGFVGKTVISATGERLSKITALDPAGPLFTDPNNRLNKTDARTVAVIHTDGRMFGYFDPLGTVDFYPNGGAGFQPGCLTLDVILMQNLWCSHHKSRSYFVESINQVLYWATKCDSWNNYRAGYCEGNEKIKFSEEISADARGSYYFMTNDY